MAIVVFDDDRIRISGVSACSGRGLAKRGDQRIGGDFCSFLLLRRRPGKSHQHVEHMAAKQPVDELNGEFASALGADAESLLLEPEHEGDRTYEIADEVGMAKAAVSRLCFQALGEGCFIEDNGRIALDLGGIKHQIGVASSEAWPDTPAPPARDLATGLGLWIVAAALPSDPLALAWLGRDESQRTRSLGSAREAGISILRGPIRFAR